VGNLLHLNSRNTSFSTIFSDFANFDLTTSHSKAGSRNPPPPLSPLLIQLRTVSNMTAYGERLGDDAMGVQGSRARFAGMLAGGVWFRVVRAAVIMPADVNASVLHSAVLGGVVRPP